MKVDLQSLFSLIQVNVSEGAKGKTERRVIQVNAGVKGCRRVASHRNSNAKAVAVKKLTDAREEFEFVLSH